MTRAKHLQWCKDRALEYVESGDYSQAVASMVSDLNKHDETRDSVSMAFHLGMAVQTTNNKKEVEDYINGFI